MGFVATATDSVLTDKCPGTQASDRKQKKYVVLKVLLH